MRKSRIDVITHTTPPSVQTVLGATKKAAPRPRATFALLALAILIGFASCTQAEENVAKIALVYSVDVRKPGYKKAMEACARIVEEEMRKDHVFDKRIVIETFHNKGTAEGARAVAKRILADEHIYAVVGYVMPECLTDEVKRLYEKNNMLVISPTLRTDNAIQGGGSAYRLAIPARVEGLTLARYLEESIRKDDVVVFYENSVFAKEALQSFEESLGKRATIHERFLYRAGEFHFEPYATKVKQIKPEVVVVFGTFEEAAHICLSFKQKHIEPAPRVIGTSGIVDKDFITIAGENAVGVCAISPFHFSEGVSKDIDTFNDAYESESGKMKADWIALQTYESFHLILHALKQYGFSRKGILEYARTLTTQEDAYESITGRVYFDANRELQRLPTIVTVAGRRDQWQWVRAQTNGFTTKKTSEN